jgi:hypothetical protein
MHQSSLLWSVLNILTKDRLEAIKQVFGSLDEAAGNIDAQFLRGLGCRNDTVTAVLQRMEEFDQEKEEQEIENTEPSSSRSMMRSIRND